jgi:hypothetical protein
MSHGHGDGHGKPQLPAPTGFLAHWEMERQYKVDKMLYEQSKTFWLQDQYTRCYYSNAPNHDEACRHIAIELAKTSSMFLTVDDDGKVIVPESAPVRLPSKGVDPVRAAREQVQREKKH